VRELLRKTKNRMAKPRRSGLKTASWAIIAFTITIVLMYLWIGEIAISLGVGIIDRVIKIAAYYFHERAWAHIDWGRRHRNDD
jgi:adenylylsulfate kinase